MYLYLCIYRKVTDQTVVAGIFTVKWALFETLGGSSPIGLANTDRSASVSEIFWLNSASFWLLYHRCQMCLVACRLSLTNSACPPLSFPRTICPQTLPQHLHLCNPLLVCNTLDFTTLMSRIHSLVFTC